MPQDNIVIISNYYPPEIGAAANRIKNMAVGLTNNGYSVSIICPLPNYPEGRIFKNYRGRFVVYEKEQQVDINRYWKYPSNSKNVFVRFISMASFAITMWFSLYKLIKLKPKFVIVQSPPLFVAFSALLLSKLIRSKSVLNVSDLWPLSAFELGKLKKSFFYRFLEFIERKNYQMATKIIGQSNETINYIKKIVVKEFLVYRNVPMRSVTVYSKKREGSLKLVYAGLLGYAQGILNLCNQINFNELNVEFHIYGRGMEEKGIKEYVKCENTNVFYHGSFDSDEIKNEIVKYDIALVSLADSIYGAVPSKIFEMMQLKMPILFRGSGEGALIIKNESIGLNSASNDYNELINNIKLFSEMDDYTYNKFLQACEVAHNKKYNLEIEITKLRRFLSNFDKN